MVSVGAATRSGGLPGGQEKTGTCLAKHLSQTRDRCLEVDCDWEC